MSNLNIFLLNLNIKLYFNLQSFLISRQNYAFKTIDRKMSGKRNLCYLGTHQRDYMRRASATGRGGKVVEVVQGHRRRAG